MAIVHYTISMPMRWLVGNTHHIGAQGYDWSARSMGMAIDAIYDAMLEVEQDGPKFLDEDFMKVFFPEYMKTQMEMRAHCRLLGMPWSLHLSISKLRQWMDTKSCHLIL